MGEGADGNEIHAGPGDGANGFQGHAAAGFGAGAAIHEPDRSSQVLQIHVVQQHDVGAGFHGLRHLPEGVGFHFNFQLRKFFSRAGDGGSDGIGFFISQGGQVIVLDQNHVEKAQAMIFPAAAGDGVFLKAPPAGRGFAGVENLRSGSVNRGDELRGQRRHAGEPLQEIQRHAFGAQNGAGRAVNFQQRGAGGHRLAVAGALFDLDARRQSPKGRLRKRQAGQDQIFPGAQDGDGGGAGGNHRQGGDVAPAKILGQRGADGFADFGGRQFHGAKVSAKPGREKEKAAEETDLIPRSECFILRGVNIPEHRQAIDRLDAQIVRLLNARTRHVLAIGDIKRRAGEEIYAPHRERAVLDRVTALNQGPMTDEQLRAVYREIMSAALALEKTMIIAYLGPEATFTHQAAIRRFGSSLNYAAQKTITDVFIEVSKGRADYGVVPVENSTEGIVTHTLDMFVDSDLKIVSQIVLPIQYCLAAKTKTARARIGKIYVHPQALGQCRSWIQNNLPQAEILEASSNARSAELAARDRTAAAVTGFLAAEKYGLQILEPDIQDNAANATRFLVLGRQCSPPTGRDRTSLMISVSDKVGALHQALSAFRRYKINLTKIESRPSKRRAWEYFFFIDCDGHAQDKDVARAIELLGRHCHFVKILGSYPNAE